MTVDSLRRRAEELLGWKEGESTQFSLQTLREFVRPKSPKLADMMNSEIQSGRVLLGAFRKPRRVR